MIEKILKNNIDEHQIILLCSIKNDKNDPLGLNRGIAILSKTEFDTQWFTDVIENKVDMSQMLKTRLYFNNNQYHKFWFDFA